MSVLVGKGAPLVLWGQVLLFLDAEWRIVSYCFMWLSKFGIIMEIYYVKAVERQDDFLILILYDVLSGKDKICFLACKQE